jgi:hypothetical protein
MGENHRTFLICVFVCVCVYVCVCVCVTFIGRANFQELPASTGRRHQPLSFMSTNSKEVATLVQASTCYLKTPIFPCTTQLPLFLRHQPEGYLDLLPCTTFRPLFQNYSHNMVLSIIISRSSSNLLQIHHKNMHQMMMSIFSQVIVTENNFCHYLYHYH